ncbi:MAG: hypothetical protein WB608_00350 [Terracidiphilus sp.]
MSALVNVAARNQRQRKPLEDRVGKNHTCTDNDSRRHQQHRAEASGSGIDDRFG